MRSSTCPVLVLMLLAGAARAGEKNGVAPTAVSLPSGPGTIEGLGESFEPMLQTGTARYSLPLPLPPGVAGNTPGLALAYDGGFGNGPVGYGWKCGAPSMQRQCERGIPRYLDAGALEDADTFLGADGTELIELENGAFLSRIEGSFTRCRRVWADALNDPGNFHWEAHTRDGTLLEYGLSDSARVFLPAAESPSGHTQIYCWKLERTTDVHGNQVEYRYSDLGRPAERQKYLVEVRYGPGEAPWDSYYFAHLEYEDRPDGFTDARAGFLVTTSRRLRQVDMGIHGAPAGTTPGCKSEDLNEDGAVDALIRRYEILYENHDHWSLLSQVFAIGSDGVSSLPPAAFRYGSVDEDLDTERTIALDDAALVASSGEPLLVDDTSRVDLVDLNHDGLPDLLQTASGVHYAYLNHGVEDGRLEWGERLEPELDVGQPVPEALDFELDMPNVHLADMDADGASDLVVTQIVTPGVRYYRNLGGGSFWGEAQSMSIETSAPPPPFESTADDVRTIDLNFDKLIDTVESTPAGYRVWYNRGGGVYAAEELVPGAVVGPEGQQELLQFSDPRVQLADLNGDRLVDVARLEPGRIVHATSLGRGRFAEHGVIDLPDGFRLTADQLERTSLRDLNGDGLADLLVERADGNTLWFWTNLGTGALSKRRIVTGLPALPAATRADFADMNGNGSIDLVYSNSGLPDGFRFQFIDLGELIDGSATPRQLETIDNGLGLRTEIAYRSSTEDYREAWRNGNPWTVANPNPLPVIASVRRSTGLDLDGFPGIDIYEIEFSYRDGYYDPVRRQFCGFGFVKRITHGDERVGGTSARTLVERFRFHTGGPDGVDNDRDGEIDEVDAWMGREEEPLKGAPLWTESTSLPDDPSRDGEYADDAQVFERTVSPLQTWEVRRIARSDGGALADLLGDSYRTRRSDREVLLPVFRQSDRYLIEEGRGPAKHLRTTTDVNALGDRLFEWELGEFGDDAPTSDDRYTEYQYAHNVEAWILGVSTRTRVRKGGPAGAFVSETRSYYDGEPFVGLPLGELGDRALPHRTEHFLSQPGDWAPESAPLPDLREFTTRVGDPRQPQASVDLARQEYDAFGNAIASLDANGNRRDYAHDETLRIFTISETIHTGQPGGPLRIEADHHFGHGTTLASRDFNGNETRYEYDFFGRPARTVRPGDSLDYPTQRYLYTMSNPRPLMGLRPLPHSAPLELTEAITFHYDVSGSVSVLSAEEAAATSSVQTSLREEAGAGTFDSVSYFDGAGKELATLEEAEVAGEWVVISSHEYNLRQAPRRRFLPYRQTGVQYRTPAASTAPHSDLFYDAVGRMISSSTPPDSSGARHESRTVYRPLQVDGFDAEDTVPGGRHANTYSSTLTDGLGRTVRVVERNERGTDPEDEATEYVIRYTWNLQDRPVATTDAQDNTRYARYDGLGRKIFLNDPDAGERAFVYDPMGNLIELLDARGRRTVYTYDGANRRLSRNFLQTNGDPSTDPPEEVFAYDVTIEDVDRGDGTRATTRNPRGRLVSVTDLSGAFHSSFDERGRVEWSTRRIADPLTDIAVHYTTSYTYDSLDRVASMTYPDNDRVTYEYDSRSLLRTIRGGPEGRIILADRTHDAAERVLSSTLGNGVRCENRYDPRLRRVESTLLGAGLTTGRELLHYAYTFDGVSNLLSIADLRPGVAATERRHNSQRFEYDDLYRLTRFQLTDSSLDSAVNRGEISYRHDRIGNLLYRRSPTSGPGRIGPTRQGAAETNLGAYQYLGGRGGRFGRQPEDPPGPHAVTSTESGRRYHYDANGNATQIDGLQAEWDHVDRLVALRGPGFSAEYVYDHANQRVVKRVERSGQLEWVLYVNSGFEIREGEEPTKFVFADEARVARVRGTLDPTRPRVQRIRLVEGWNLVSVAVRPPIATAGAIFGLDEVDAAVSSIVTFDGSSFRSLAGQDAVSDREPYWVHASRAAIVTVVGTYAPGDMQVTQLSAGLNVLAWPRLQGLIVDDSFEGIREVWSYDSAPGNWRTRSLVSPGAADSIALRLPPASGVWVFASEEPSPRFEPAGADDQDVLFYHADHLGSSNIVTDLQGRVVEETSYYPFGGVRTEERELEWFETAYKYAGKERDRESGLDYLGARYYEPVLGRFVSPDPKYRDSLGQGSPQSIGLYTYARNNPLAYVDPNGFDNKDVSDPVFKGGEWKTKDKELVKIPLYHRSNPNRQRGTLKFFTGSAGGKLGSDGAGIGAEGAIFDFTVDGPEGRSKASVTGGKGEAGASLGPDGAELGVGVTAAEVTGELMWPCFREGCLVIGAAVGLKFEAKVKAKNGKLDVDGPLASVTVGFVDNPDFDPEMAQYDPKYAPKPPAPPPPATGDYGHESGGGGVSGSSAGRAFDDPQETPSQLGRRAPTRILRPAPNELRAAPTPPPRRNGLLRKNIGRSASRELNMGL